jgi:hypothetical protein
VEGRRHTAGGYGWKYAVTDEEEIPENEL